MTVATRVHTRITLADPNLRCGVCGKRVEGFHDPERCRCGGGFYHVPCRHLAEARSTCPSWGPVDGCCCPGHPHED